MKKAFHAWWIYHLSICSSCFSTLIDLHSIPWAQKYPQLWFLSSTTGYSYATCVNFYDFIDNKPIAASMKLPAFSHK